QHPIGSGYGDGAAGPAFADDHRNIRHAERKTCVGRARDRFRLTAFFRTNAGISASGVDQGDDREPKAISHLHKAHGFSITLRACHAEIVLDPAFGIGALLMADDADTFAAESSEASHDGGVLAKLPVTGERDETGDELVDVVEAVWALRMAGN